jgi:hypothetical protein
MNKRASALTLILIMLFVSTNSLVFACGPDYDKALFVSWIHPDLPLKTYAAGNLGILQSGWARSYLCVAYRYLTGQALLKDEQASIERLWIKRLNSESPQIPYMDDAMKQYVDLRSKVLKIKPDQSWDLYRDLSHSCRENSIGDSSIVEALAIMKARIKQYGESSGAVREWLQGQDCVFGLNSQNKVMVPAPLKIGIDKTLKEDRDYQRAAATLYLFDYFKALEMFKLMAQDKNSPRHALVSYLVARCRANSSICAGAAETPSTVIASLEKETVSEKTLEGKEDLIDLIGWLRLNSESDGSNFDRLVRSVSSRPSDPLTSASYGHNVGDLTFTLTQKEGSSDAGSKDVQDKDSQDKDSQDKDSKDKDSKDKDSKERSTKNVQSEVMEHDLIAWLNTVYDGYDPFAQTSEQIAVMARRYPDDPGWIKEAKERLAKHRAILDKHAGFALSQWRTNHSVHWLVAVMLCGGLRPADRADALAAAEQIPPESPAYQTASFYVIDALSSRGELDKAGERLATVMTKKNELSISAANLFKSQRLVLSTTCDEYLTAACMRLTPSSNREVLLPTDWKRYEFQNSTVTPLGGWDNLVASDLDYNLPYSLWVKLAQRPDLPANLHARIVCAVWLRSIMLGKTQDVERFSQELAKAYPILSSKIKKYQDLAPGREKQYALASLVLGNYGMSPYVMAGLPRFAMKINEFNYYRENFWIPMRTSTTSPDDDDVSPWKSTVEGTNCPDSALMLGYYKNGITRLLSTNQKQAAAKERNQIEKHHPSALLGQAVLEEARANPSAPELPELLYKVVKLPLWSGDSSTGSKYSKEALRVLKERYPQDRWAKKVRSSY